MIADNPDGTSTLHMSLPKYIARKMARKEYLDGLSTKDDFIQILLRKENRASNKEIAAEFGIHPSTVGHKVSRAEHFARNGTLGPYWAQRYKRKSLLA